MGCLCSLGLFLSWVRISSPPPPSQMFPRTRKKNIPNFFSLPTMPSFRAILPSLAQIPPMQKNGGGQSSMAAEWEQGSPWNRPPAHSSESRHVPAGTCPRWPCRCPAHIGHPGTGRSRHNRRNEHNLPFFARQRMAQLSGRIRPIKG